MSIQVQVDFRKQYLRERARSAKRVFLLKSGALVRSAARSEIQSRRRSRRGQSPANHSGKLRDGIQFAIAETPKGTAGVIGPVLIPQNNNRSRSNRPVPAVLEFGGEVLVQISPGEWRAVTIAPRPYMSKAIQSVSPQLAGLWRGLLDR